MNSLNSHILNGCLLGDGCLNIGKRCKNANFCYRSSVKKHVEIVHKYFINYCSENYKTIKRIETYDKRTNKRKYYKGFIWKFKIL